MATRYSDSYEIVTGITDMSTAIISKQFGNAFVVGSDGLATHLDGREPNPNTRKIFELCHPGSTIVYAVMGNPEITNDATGEMVVNFPKDIARTADSQWDAGDFMEFVKRTCLPLNTALRSAREAGEILDYPSSQDSIVRVLFAGFFNGHPSQIEARFFHLDQALQEPEFRVRRCYEYGSNAVSDKIALGCPDFKKYQHSGFFSLESTVENMKKRIDAYGDPKASEIDPLCRSIGGMTQICIVRPDGIEWRYGPATAKREGAVADPHGRFLVHDTISGTYGWTEIAHCCSKTPRLDIA